MTIRANDPSLRSWVDVPADSDFPIQNLPFGIALRKQDAAPVVVVAIGDQVADLQVLAEHGFLTIWAYRERYSHNPFSTI